MEEKHVKDIYEKIAYHFNYTRTYHWHSIKKFILSFNKGSLLLDAGCGNGKNMQIRNDCNIIGIDNCRSLLDICNQKKLKVILSNIKKLPFKSNLFDGVFCVAVIHHLDSEENRYNSIKELVRVTKKKGKIFIQVWDKDLKKNKKFIKINNNNDYFITWQCSKTNEILKRYYHLFSKSELINLIIQFDIEIENIFNEKENWVLIIKKN